MLCSQKPEIFAEIYIFLTETNGNGQLNISMQQLATSFDFVLKILINAPSTV